MSPCRSKACARARSAEFCTTRPASGLPASCIHNGSTISSRECWCAKGNCFTTPAHPTSSPAGATFLPRWRRDCDRPDSSPSCAGTECWQPGSESPTLDLHLEVGGSRMHQVEAGTRRTMALTMAFMLGLLIGAPLLAAPAAQNPTDTPAEKQDAPPF